MIKNKTLFMNKLYYSLNFFREIVKNNTSKTYNSKNNTSIILNNIQY